MNIIILFYFLIHIILVFKIINNNCIVFMECNVIYKWINAYLCCCDKGWLNKDDLYIRHHILVLYTPEHMHYTYNRQSVNVWHFYSAALGNQNLWDRKDHRQESSTVLLPKRRHGKTATMALFIALPCLNTHHLCCLAGRVWHWNRRDLFLTQTPVHSVTWLYCFHFSV